MIFFETIFFTSHVSDSFTPKKVIEIASVHASAYIFLQRQNGRFQLPLIL